MSCDSPLRIVPRHPGQVADVADVVTFAVFFDVFRDHLLSAQLGRLLEGLEVRATFRAPAADALDLRHARLLQEGVDEPGHVERVDVVPDLLAFVAEDPADLAAEITLDQVAHEGAPR